MKSSLQTFELGLNNLVAYLRGTDSENRLLDSLAVKGIEILGIDVQQLIEEVRAAHVSRKQYIYAVSIVSLYGLLERYIDSVIEAHVNQLARIVESYVKLPEAIVDRHVVRSMELVKAISEDRFRGESVKVGHVIANLHSCLSGVDNFQTNGAAFVLHRGNLTLAKIGDFLSDIGVESHLRRISITSSMLSCLNILYPERDIRAVADQDLPGLFEPIDNLVQRRNEVSHGVIDIDDLQSVDLLNKSCNFVGCYVRGLHDLLLQEEAKAYVTSAKAALLGKPLEVFDNRIVCFEISSGTLAVGDLIIARTGDSGEPFRFGHVVQIQIDGQSQGSVSLVSARKLGLEVTFRAKVNYDYWVVRNAQHF